MHEPGSLRIEDCWQPGGRIRVEIVDGARVRLSGNPDGLIGLARMLLYLSHNGLADGEVVSLAAYEALEPGSPALELAES